VKDVPGSWSVIDDSGTDENHWESIKWTAEGEAIKVEARAADTENALQNREWVGVENGVAVAQDSLVGRLLQVKVTLALDITGESPILFDLETVSAVPEPEEKPCYVNEDDIVDRKDLSLIMVARNTPALSDSDPRDADKDGMITVLDARTCVLQCTYPLCSSEAGE
jgi:hypothetical protein